MRGGRNKRRRQQIRTKNPESKHPITTRVGEIIHGIEDGKYTSRYENVKLFEGLDK